MPPAAPIPSVVLHVHREHDPGDNASNAGIIFAGPIDQPPAKHLLAWFRAHGYSVRVDYLANASAALARYPTITLDVGAAIRAEAELIFDFDLQLRAPLPAQPRPTTTPIPMVGLPSSVGAPSSRSHPPPPPSRAAARTMAPSSHTSSPRRTDPPSVSSPRSPPPPFPAPFNLVGVQGPAGVQGQQSGVYGLATTTTPSSTPAGEAGLAATSWGYQGLASSSQPSIVHRSTTPTSTPAGGIGLAWS